LVREVRPGDLIAIQYQERKTRFSGCLGQGFKIRAEDSGCSSQTRE
jgi:hypothetical protein